MFKDAGVGAPHFPGREEEIPIDVGHEVLEVQLKGSNAEEWRWWGGAVVKVEYRALHSRLFQRQQWLGHFPLKQRRQPLVFLLQGRLERCATLVV